MPIVWYVSAHGFGHAARDFAVIDQMGRMRPDVRIVVRTAVPRWFVEGSVQVPIALQEADADPGIVQTDSLNIDEAETARRAAAFYAAIDRRADEEAAVLRSLGAELVVADVAPLACLAARRAGVPALVFGNFTWDWIYAGFPDFERAAPGVVAAVGGAYALARRALRLPLHGGFATIADVADIPLVARQSRRTRGEVRRILGLDEAETVVLASFGGHGLHLDYDAIAAANALTLIVVGGRERAPGDGAALPGRRGHTVLTSHDLAARGLRYEDIVLASDVVVSKPGYGIVSECIANGAALLYARRARFAEQDVFEREMPHLLRCRAIGGDDLAAGRWRAPIGALLDQPPPPVAPSTNGAQAAAAAILDELPRSG